ncbi:MAG: MBL fold metallo-hydrolase, partial [Clostridia bacterium]|nr:MBL fold metallo-hydrolase [Clostridia bacterium]
MKITAVIENKSRKEGILAQYGLSLFVQTKNGNILVDAGSNHSAFVNFTALGFSVEEINAIVVSHNHFDHIGGLRYFLDETSVPVYASNEVNTVLYTKRWYTRRKQVSDNAVVEDNLSRFKFVNDCEEIFKDVFVCRLKNPNREFVCRDKKLRQLLGGKIVSDCFAHEVYLAVVEDKKVKILSSCSHNGIVNILEDAKTRFPEYKISAFVGGLHLRGKNSQKLNCSYDFAVKTFEIVDGYD